MPVTPWFRFQDLAERKTLILGEAGSGKTKLTAEILEEAVTSQYSKEITVIDMAPPPLAVGGLRIGGRLKEFTAIVKRVKHLWDPDIKAPRLSSKTPKEVLDAVKENKARIDRMLKEYLEDPSLILIVNDVSIYLQAEPFINLFETVDIAETVVINGYYGQVISGDLGTGVSSVECKGMRLLMRIMDRLIYLKPALAP